MLNRVVLVGNLTKDPQYSKTQSGLSLVRFTGAWNRTFSKNNEADFISCIAWRQTADFVNQYVKKGQTVALEGRITTGSYDDQTTGKRVYTTDVTVDNLQLVGSRQARDPQTSEPQSTTSGYYPDVQTKSVEDDFETGPLLDISSDDLPF